MLEIYFSVTMPTDYSNQRLSLENVLKFVKNIWPYFINTNSNFYE